MNDPRAPKMYSAGPCSVCGDAGAAVFVLSPEDQRVFLACPECGAAWERPPAAHDVGTLNPPAKFAAKGFRVASAEEALGSGLVARADQIKPYASNRFPGVEGYFGPEVQAHEAARHRTAWRKMKTRARVSAVLVPLAMAAWLLGFGRLGLVGGIVGFVLASGLVMWVNFAYFFYPCPRCGQPFTYNRQGSGFGTLYSKKCRHCGLPRGFVPGQAADVPQKAPTTF